MNADTGNAAYLGTIPSMVAFLPGLSSEERTDIQNVLLDAQLFAGRQFDFKTQWGTWMHYYRPRSRSVILRIASVLVAWCSVRSRQWGWGRPQSRTFRAVSTRDGWAVFRSYPAKSMNLAGCSCCFAVCT